MQDRYVVRQADSPDRWCVWDMHHNAVVLGAKDLFEPQAREFVQRLNDAYRRSMTDE